jgi:hypothetical protein
MPKVGETDRSFDTVSAPRPLPAHGGRRAAALLDAVQAGQALADESGVDGLQWRLPGTIEEGRRDPERDEQRPG